MWNSSNYLTSFFQKTSSTPTSADHYHVLWQTSRGISNSFHKNVLLDGAREHKWTKNGLGILKTHVMQLKRNFLWLLWPEKKSASTGQPKTQSALCTGGQLMQVDQKPCEIQAKSSLVDSILTLCETYKIKLDCTFLFTLAGYNDHYLLHPTIVIL